MEIEPRKMVKILRLQQVLYNITEFFLFCFGQILFNLPWRLQRTMKKSFINPFFKVAV